MSYPRTKIVCTLGPASSDRDAICSLLKAGIDYETVTKQLEREGVDSFAKSFDQLLGGVERKRQELAHGR